MSQIPGYKPDGLTSFETRVPVELAFALQKITTAYLHRGNAARAAFLARLEAAIPTPADEPDA